MRFAEYMALAQTNEAGCLIWPGRIVRYGYGRIGSEYAHRRAWRVARGPIPEGLTIDHLCFTPACVNVDHLQLATFDENRRRNRPSLATHCKRGHEFTPENTYLKPSSSQGRRQCRACQREAVARYKAGRAAA